MSGCNGMVGVATSESVVRRVMMSVLLCTTLSILGCRAPAPVLEAEDLATQIENEYVSAVQVRLTQWRQELSHSWEKELRYVLERELSAKADDSGKVTVEDVLSLLALQGEAREKNVKRLALEGDADQAATAGWRESRRIRDSVRRWLEAGMTEEQKTKVYSTVLEVANDRQR